MSEEVRSSAWKKYICNSTTYNYFISTLRKQNATCCNSISLSLAATMPVPQGTVKHLQRRCMQAGSSSVIALEHTGMAAVTIRVATKS
jgi:hypothetical protein